MSQIDYIFIRNNVLTIRDIARLLSVSKQRVCSMIQEGIITPARVDQPILFSRSEVERYIKKTGDKRLPGAIRSDN